MAGAPAFAGASCGVTVTVAPGMTPPLGSETVISNFELGTSNFELCCCAAAVAANADTPIASARNRRRISNSYLLRDFELVGVDLSVDLDLLEGQLLSREALHHSLN